MSHVRTVQAPIQGHSLGKTETALAAATPSQERRLAWWDFTFRPGPAGTTARLQSDTPSIPSLTHLLAKKFSSRSPASTTKSKKSSNEPAQPRANCSKTTSLAVRVRGLGTESEQHKRPHHVALGHTYKHGSVYSFSTCYLAIALRVVHKTGWPMAAYKQVGGPDPAGW